MGNQLERELDLADAIYEAAEQLFSDLGFKDDFCHQTGNVFGGWNRVILTSKGWKMDRSYCTEKFITAFEEYMKNEQESIR